MKLKILIIGFLALTLNPAFGQKNIPATNEIEILGEVKNPKTFSLNELKKLDAVAIEDFHIYNHKGEKRSTLTGLKGIPLKELLSPVQFNYDSPKTLNEIYFVFTASDDYKVVFSWNEIYNTEAGNNFYIITEMDGKKLEDLAQRIPFLSTKDLKTGRRYIKGLQKIEVKKVD